MGTLHYGINLSRKEIFCLGKYSKYSIVQPMWDGATDEEIIKQAMGSETSAITRTHFTSLVARIRVFNIHKVIHEDDLDLDGACTEYEDYIYKDSVYVNDSDMFGKTVRQHSDENGY
jgi:hypothetical protein